MGRTLSSITMVYYNELSALSPFRRALRRSDQLALDVLFAAAHKHLAEAAYAAHPLPMEIFLLAMLLEEHKEVMGLRERVRELKGVRQYNTIRPHSALGYLAPAPEAILFQPTQFQQVGLT